MAHARMAVSLEQICKHVDYHDLQVDTPSVNPLHGGLQPGPTILASPPAALFTILGPSPVGSPVVLLLGRCAVLVCVVASVVLAGRLGRARGAGGRGILSSAAGALGRFKPCAPVP